MRKGIMLLLFSAFLLGSLVTTEAAEIDSGLDHILNSKSGSELVGAIIYMADRVDLTELTKELDMRKASLQERHEIVVRALQNKASHTQSGLLSYLENAQKRGDVESFQSRWISNIITVNAKASFLRGLSDRYDIDKIYYNYETELITPQDTDTPLTDDLQSVEIGVEVINAPQVWAMGITGAGRLCANIDTGVDGNHPALYDRWRGHDPRYDGHPEWAWLDPYLGNNDFPYDAGGHGTHTMGTACGASPAGDTIGVAIGAQWMASGAIDRGGGIPQTVADAIISFEWMVDPDGDPGTNWDVPDVCSNSWGVTTGHGYPPCDETFWEYLDACEAVGIVIVFSAGNEAFSGLRRPADRATTDLNAYSVGAVDARTLNIASFSSRGPSNCTPNGSSTIKPEISAPGVDVRSSIPGGGYGTMSGTSMASPHINGVVALMREANPNLSVDLIKEIMMDTAVDLGPDGPDNDFGAGMVDAYAAVQRAIALLEGYGLIMGRVTDMTNGNGLAAMVEITNREPAIFGMCSAEGYYSMYVPADSLWDLKASFPPDYLPVFDQMMVAENETVTVNFELEPKVEVMIMAQFANPDDVSYREFYIDGTWDNDGFYDADRSGDYLVIADDGEYPDETAGDGIFTGSIKLATDLDNTYQWALFCENYGVEDAAFMQNGAGFNVTDPGNPPDVPILQVNPSGSDPNWGFSVVGTNGLDLDLMGGVNSDPFKWGAAVELTQGLTYSFRFHIMHSSLPRYGIGGIGGDAIPYECTFTGFYDFIFNDSTDSYLVQLTGEEGPPTYLSVASGLDGHIPVAWMPPGTVESTEMIYDDGTLANGYYYYAFDAIMANMFVPPSYPCIIDSLLIHVLTEGDEYWPWPDGTHDPVKLTVWLDSNNDGMPDDSVFFAEATVPDGVGQWIRVDTPEIEVPNGTNFWIGMSNINGGGDDGIGLDIITDFPAHKWSRFDGVWGLEASFEGDHMIRAKVFTNEGISGLQYDNLPTGTRLPNSGIGLAQGGSSTHGTGATLPGLSASEEDQFPSPDMYFPKLVYGKGNRAGQDIQVLAGYNLYRSTSSGPYAQDLKINSELISETTYDDWGVDDYGPIVNGQLYYYEATAIYDVGGGDFVEIGPSNETTGQAENHPPETPLNLIGDVVDHDVYLDWSPNGDYDIDEYNIYRRDYNQSEFNLVGTVVHPDTSYTEFVASDGIYRYKITAVDREDAESGFSGNVDLAVGLIPPGILQATEDLDSRIDLRWRNPGGRDILEDLNILFLISDYPDAQTEVEDFLINSGEVESADFFDAQNGTPTFEDIQDYDLVLTWANYPYFDPTGIGDVLAEYVEEGGAVVACEFAFYGSWAMGGRFMDEYSPFTQANAYFVNVSLGDYDPGHPLMQDVNDVGEYFCSDVTAHEYAETVASWDNGWPFVAYNTDAPSVVAINGYVGSPDRQWTGDMLQVVLNSVLFTASGGGIEPDGFNLYKADNESGPFELLAELPGTDNEYSDDPVPNNTDYYYQVTAVYNSEESEPSNTAHGYAVPGARLAVSPDSYELFVSQGQIETRNLYISNEGGLPMDFDITVIQDGRIMLRNPHKSPNDDFGFEKDPFERYSRSDDEAKQTEPGGDNPPMTLDSGGPDEFGYTWVDSNEPGGPEFSWVDIEGRGTPLVMSDDDNQGPFDLDFNFSFYGNSFDNIRICSNGWLSFTSTNYDYTNYPIPDPNYPTNLIALFWDDMNPADGGQILYWAGDDSFVVSWINVPRYSAGGSFTYQAILTSDGSITYQYDYMEGELASATIGIQNEDGTIGLQVAYDQYYVEEGLAVKIQPGWLTVTPSFGHVVEGGTDSVEVKFDASSLDAGDYTGSLTVYGWDRYHQEDPITVPVDLHVAPTDVPSSPDAILPVVFRLHQNYPNPFNPVTSIQYDLPVNCHVKLDVINILGQRVRTVIDKNETAGYKSVVWDGKNDSGLRVTSGIYFYKISAGDYNNVKKMTVIK